MARVEQCQSPTPCPGACRKLAGAAMAEALVRAGSHWLVPLTNNLAVETRGPARKVMVPESAIPRPDSVRE